ncbi:hypothetical protein BJ322DRAFT_1109605 [Thelephora terrestris]|uniref:Uncharacterized protein n=1 Tax=Thelephora terrestris TaxID=56493 RepID=A0A9P6HCF2_9AGAM|nr:hypothetical protein BJ322DRAFT_1109605 [Thelephora terrestris]
MSKRSAVSSNLEAGLTNSLPLPLESAVELPARPRDGHTSTPRPTRRPREEGERGGDESEEVRRLRRDVGGLKGQLDRERVEVGRLRKVEENLMAACKRREDRVTRLCQEIEKMRSLHQGILEEQARQARAVEERLKRTEELLAARSAELSETRTFLSTTDRLSEMEVLSIVRDLNENIFQVAVSLTDEWEKLEPLQAASQMDIDPASLPYSPILIQLARNRDLTGLTFLLQSCFCSQAVKMTSRWSDHSGLAALKSVHENLSISGGQAISARWRSLAHSNLVPPSPDSSPLVEQLASTLYETGSFPSPQHSIEFVQAYTFMVEVVSSDMSLLFEAPGTVFDARRMTSEFGADSGSSPGTRSNVMGTTEVGVGKSISGGSGDTRRVEILLKTKVVLERDVVGDEGHEAQK